MMLKRLFSIEASVLRDIKLIIRLEMRQMGLRVWMLVNIWSLKAVHRLKPIDRLESVICPAVLRARELKVWLVMHLGILEAVRWLEIVGWIKSSGWLVDDPWP